MVELDADVLAYYERGGERSRLADNCPLEDVRTKSLIERYLPEPPAKVLDVGGGPGAYAAWLADLGYRVDLIDPVPLHVEQAQSLGKSGLVASLGDSRHIDRADESVDAVLLLGPLYHLPDVDDRMRTLLGCRRVLRPDGVLLAAAISRWAGVFDLVIRSAVDTDALMRWWAGVAETGTQRAADAPGFTTAYFHRPSDLAEELTEAGFRDVSVLGIEGIGGVLPDQAARMADASQRDLLLAAAAITEDEPALAGLSPHLLAVGRR